MTEQLRCVLDDRLIEEVSDGQFIHSDDGTPVCFELIEIVEVH